MSTDARAWTPRHNHWAVALTVTIATFMEVLDTSIANVALPHIAGSLSASVDESTWVLTSYLVANAVVLPLSAWISDRVGRKRFYMTCVLLFTVSSFFCGLSQSLPMLIFFRVLQGIGGGGLAPSEQAILADTFPPVDARGGLRHVRNGRGARARHRPHARRLHYRPLFVALDLLHQYPGRNSLVVPDLHHGGGPSAHRGNEGAFPRQAGGFHGRGPRGHRARLAGGGAG